MNQIKQSVAWWSFAQGNITVERFVQAAVEIGYEAALQRDPTIDGILALGPLGSLPAIKALQNLNKAGKIKLATFDLSSEVLTVIKGGQMLFAIDQQPYLQGYLPIVMLTLYKTNLNTIANDVLMTGPSFVTSANVSQVIQLTSQGTR